MSDDVKTTNSIVIPTAENALNRTPITAADVAQYEKWLEAGNVDAIYQDLQKKGFDSGYWLISEFNKGTSYGATNALYWKAQTGK